MTSVALSMRAPAKINWNLRVLGRRDDGFHEIESLVSAVTFYDELTFAGRGESAIELRCDDSGVPTDGRNLVLQAATLLSERAGCREGVTCRLTKRIPVGGGLGGGSSDAACTLMALNRLWGLNWERARLAPLATWLGSDVLFFLYGRSAVMSGRGDRVHPVELGWQGWIVLVLPGLAISTAAVYGAWEPGEDSSAGSMASAFAEHSVEATVKTLTKNGAAEWMEQTFNMLEPAVMKVCPRLRGFVDRAERLAGRPVRVSGSGSTLFTAFDEKGEAEHFARLVGEECGVGAVVVRLVEKA